MGRARVRMVWHDREVQRAVKRELQRRLPQVGEYFRGELVRAIRENSTRASGPSTPHDFPHVSTGRLSQSYFSDFDRSEMSVTVGSPLKYALYLEEGTRKMEPRPHLQPMFYRLLRQMKRMLTRPMKGMSFGLLKRR